MQIRKWHFSTASDVVEARTCRRPKRHLRGQMGETCCMSPRVRILIRPSRLRLVDLLLGSLNS